MQFLDILGLVEADLDDPRAVKTAYARLVKQYRPDTHPTEFARVREAYEMARRYLEWRQVQALRAQEAPEDGDAQAPAAAPAQDEIDTETETETETRSESEAAAPSTVMAMVPPDLPDLDIEGEQPSLPSPPPLPSSPRPPTHATEPPPVVRMPEPAQLAATSPSPPDAKALVVALHHRWQQDGDDAVEPTLVQLLSASTTGPIDDRQALEVALLQWFLGVPAPSMRLLFIAGREFDWAHSEACLRQWVSDEGLARLAALLLVARDIAWARAGTNPWLRALFTPMADDALPRVGSTSAMRDARAWCAIFLAHAQAASLPPGALGWQPAAWQRLQRPLLCSTDVLLPLIVASIAAVATDAGDSLPASIGLAAFRTVAGAAALMLLRPLWVRAWQAPAFAQWRQKAVNGTWGKGQMALTFGVATAVVLVCVQMSVESDSGPLRSLSWTILAAPPVVVAVALAWRLVAWLELQADAPLRRHRTTLDRFAFSQQVGERRSPIRLPGGLWPDKATRRRAGVLAAEEQAGGHRPATPGRRRRSQPFAGPPASGFFNWRWAWALVWVAFQVFRLATH